LSVVFKSLGDLLSVSLSLILWKSASPKHKWFPKCKVWVTVLNQSDRGKVLDLLKGGVWHWWHYGKNE
jgi:hypothetical protein